MKCTQCGRRELVIMGGVIAVTSSEKSYVCSRCTKAKDEALNAQLRGRRCEVCGEFPRYNTAWRTDPNGLVVQVWCSECHEKLEWQKQARRIADENHIEILRDIWRLAAERGLRLRDITDSYKPLAAIVIDHEAPPKRWKNKGEEVSLIISVDGDQAVGMAVSGLESVEVFRVTVGPNSAEQVVNLAQIYIASRNP